ncbi:hypothetical protein [Cryomorpha ignava]|nr:hypothetical protein [Cryomorpha ignava]
MELARFWDAQNSLISLEAIILHYSVSDNASAPLSNSNLIKDET